MGEEDTGKLMASTGCVALTYLGVVSRTPPRSCVPGIKGAALELVSMCVPPPHLFTAWLRAVTFTLLSQCPLSPSTVGVNGLGHGVLQGHRASACLYGEGCNVPR